VSAAGCGLCEVTSPEMRTAWDRGEVVVWIDWFGDGIEHHPKSDFPVPSPHIPHGVIWRTREQELHRCGSFLHDSQIGKDNG
jgi:hypothetical protein